MSISIVYLYRRSFRNHKFINIFKQDDLLPGVEKFEFPMEKLEFIGELGSGNYGKVFKAIAKQIKSNVNETTVAVKMIKDKDDYEVRHNCL